MGFIRDLFSSPKPPPPVDYGAIGREQSAENIEAARVGARLARPDVVTPYSTTTYRPFGEEEDQFLSTLTLTPEYERLRTGEAGIQTGLQDLARGRLGQIPEAPLSTAGFVPEPEPFAFSSVPGQPAYSTAEATYNIPGYENLNAYTTNAANDFFSRATARLNPEFDRAERGLRTQLITTGIPEGSDAYNEEFRLFRQGKADALTDLASQSVFQGQQLSGNILSNILMGRGQQLQEIGTQYDVAQSQRQLGIAEDQQQIALRREARDRQIAEAARLRQLPMSELSALMTGTTPFANLAAMSPTPVAGVRGPVPADLGAIAAAGQADALARYQGQQQQQATALGIPTTLLAAQIGRPR